MGVKISELPAASALAGTEPLPLVQADETRKATVADIAPVRSVAGKAGAVTLDPSDCGAAAAIHDHDYAATSHHHDSDYADITHAHAGTYEPILGNPASNDMILSSTAAGVRSWVEAQSGIDDELLALIYAGLN